MIRTAYESDAGSMGSTGYTGAGPSGGGMTGDPAGVEDTSALADEREAARLRIEEEERQKREDRIAAWRASQEQPPPAPVATPAPSPFAGSHADVDALMGRLLERAPLTVPGAAQIATTPGPTAAQVANVAAPTAARIGPTAAAAPAALQRVSLAKPGTVEAFVGDRSQVAGRQLGLADMLTAAARGEESPGAAQVRRELAESEAAQMSMAASASPAQRAIALREAMSNTGRARGAAASEIASRNLAHQVATRGQLIDLLGGTRQADIAETQGEMGAINAARGLTAELGTRTNIAGAQIGAQQAGQAAELEQQARLANMSAANAAAMRQAELEQQAGLAGAEMSQQRALTQAGLDQGSSLAGFEAAAARAAKQAELEQQSGLAGASLGLQAEGQRDSAMMALLNTRNQLLELEQRGDLSREEIEARKAMLTEQLAAQMKIAKIDPNNPDGGLNWGGAAAGAASGAAAGTAILPGWGTAVGGVVGGVAGLFG